MAYYTSKTQRGPRLAFNPVCLKMAKPKPGSGALAVGGDLAAAFFLANVETIPLFVSTTSITHLILGESLDKDRVYLEFHGFFPMEL